MQSYIMFQKWNVQDDFSFTSAVVAVAFALANIWFVPLKSPCFEDSRGLASKPPNRARQSKAREMQKEVEKVEKAAATTPPPADAGPKEVVVE